MSFGRQKRRSGGLLDLLLNVILIFALILTAISAYVSFVSKSGNGVPSIFGFSFHSIQTDSMYPELKSGDLLIDTSVSDPSELRSGDIITYWTVINGERVLNTHRIVSVYDGGGFCIFETMGDNNTAVDSLTVHESEIVGTYKARIGGVGKIFDFLQTSTGFFILIIIAAMLLFASGIRIIKQAFKRH